VFILEARVEVVREQILRASREERFAVIAYCFMPDHLHLLVHGQAEDADLKRFISVAKQRSGYDYAQKPGARLWQRYGYERVLRESEPTSVVARYILENPVRARLVGSVEDYPFVGSFECTRQELIEYVA
jgi:putative transposase